MKKVLTLFSYCIPYDDGAAPNPHWGTMTLAICKPVIRRTAQKNDWIVGTGSSNSPIGDIHNSIVYVMKISEVMTLKKYDEYCKKYLLNKIPDINSNDLRKHVGDCIYDYSSGLNPKLRESVHKEVNIETDLGGVNVLLSDHFYYFGDHPLYLPERFQSIIKGNQGHKSTSNNDIAEEFINWIGELYIPINSLVGKSQLILDLRKDKNKVENCANNICTIDELDECEFKKNIC